MPADPEAVMKRILSDTVLKPSSKLVLLSLLFSPNNCMGMNELAESIAQDLDRVSKSCTRLAKEGLVEVQGFKVFLAIKVEGRKLISCNVNERLKNPILAIKDRFYSLYSEAIGKPYIFKKGDMVMVRKAVTVHGSNVVLSLLDPYFDTYVRGRKESVSVSDFHHKLKELKNS